MRVGAVLIALAIALVGCAGLILRDDDSAGTKVAKVLTRIALAVPSVTASELIIGAQKFEEEMEEAREANRRSWQAFYERIGRARNLGELISMLGMPTRCVNVSASDQVCEWVQDSRRTAGVMVFPLGNLALAAPIRRGYVLSVTCRLPQDGSDREPGSCRIQ